MILFPRFYPQKWLLFLLICISCLSQVKSKTGNSLIFEFLTRLQNEKLICIVLSLFSQWYVWLVVTETGKLVIALKNGYPQDGFIGECVIDLSLTRNSG